MAVDAATTTATGALFNFPSLTTGSGIDVTSASSNLGTAGAVVEISQTSGTMSSANAAVLSLKQAGAYAQGGFVPPISPMKSTYDDLATNTSYSIGSYGMITNTTTIIQPVVQEV